MDDTLERRVLYAAGIKLRPHHLDPARGWVATTRYGQVGPLPSKQDVIDQALLLIHDGDRDSRERNEAYTGIARVLSVLRRLLNT